MTKPTPSGGLMRRVVIAARFFASEIIELERGRPEWIAAGRPRPRRGDTGPK